MCLGCQQVVRPADWGTEQSVPDDAGAASVALARHVLWPAEVQAPQETSKLDALPARRVFVTVYDGGRARTATALGASMGAAVRLAAAELREQPQTRSERRVRVDIVTDVETAQLQGDTVETSAEQAGLAGVWLDRAWGHCFVTPGEVIERAMWDRALGGIAITPRAPSAEHRHPSFATVAARRQTDCKSLTASGDYKRFFTAAWVDDDSSGTPRALYRGHYPIPDATAEALYRAAVLGADYLVRMLDAQGRFHYGYFAETDELDDDYNMLRHAGAAYALAQMFARTQVTEYRAASKRALNYLVQHSEHEQRAGGRAFMFVPDDNKAKLGGAALAVIALAEYAEASDDKSWLPEMRLYGQFILSSIDASSGEPRSYYSGDGRFETKNRASVYYPGESLLALARLYIIDHDERWLDAAHKIARYLIRTRDAGKSTNELEHDHWLMIALATMQTIAPRPEYGRHAAKLATAIMDSERGADDETVRRTPDYIGSFYDPPRSTPSAIRLEGVTAMMDLARRSDDLAAVERLRPVAQRMAQHILLSQFRASESYYVPEPSRALGGVRSGIHDQYVRIDYVQHAISGWLGLEKQLRP